MPHGRWRRGLPLIGGGLLSAGSDHTRDAYARDLAVFSEFLAGRGRGLRQAIPDDVAA